MNTEKEMIEKVSNLYRKNLKYSNDIKNEITKLRYALKNNTITHIEYINIESRLKTLENNLIAQSYKIQGILLAREALLN